jgi:ribosomal protein S18 acetylase RimI-like enzyme
LEQYIIRKATCDDIWFLIDTIIQAEKGNSNKLGLSTLFELTEDEVRAYLRIMLQEEVVGCEFSVSSFMIAEIDGTLVAAMGGWIEGENDDNMASSILKANLMAFTIPNEKLLNINTKSNIIKDVLIDREIGTLQIEYVYVVKEHRGKGLLERLINAHIQQNSNIKNIQVQVFANNESAVNAYIRLGFKVHRTYYSIDDQILEYLPDKSKILMQKDI